MDREKLVKTIYNYIKKNGGVSFVEIERIFEDNRFDYKGDQSLLVQMIPNVVVWAHWNKEAFNILNELIDLGVELKPASPYIYFIDGKVLKLPLAKNLNGYKKTLHWLPVVMNVGR